MIPKVVHYCWFSAGEKPQKIRECIESWKRYLPDYEIKCWNYENFPRGKSQWVDQAVDAKKFAFAADYIRAYALFNEGGIYLDSDVEVLKSFNSLLYFPYFIGEENDGIWEAAVIGSERGLLLFKELLNYYDRNSFKTHKGYNTKPLPKVLRGIGENLYDVEYISSLEDFDYRSEKLQILPFDYFSPKSYKTNIISLSSRTFAIHHFTASWHGKKEKIYKMVEKFFGKQCAQILSSLYKKF